MSLTVINLSSTHLWAADQAYRHLKRTFDLACKEHIAIMEPHLPAVVGATERKDEIEAMREALKATIKQRYETRPRVLHVYTRAPKP